MHISLLAGNAIEQPSRIVVFAWLLACLSVRWLGWFVLLRDCIWRSRCSSRGLASSRGEARRLLSSRLGSSHLALIRRRESRLGTQWPVGCRGDLAEPDGRQLRAGLRRSHSFRTLRTLISNLDVRRRPSRSESSRTLRRAKAKRNCDSRGGGQRKSSPANFAFVLRAARCVSSLKLLLCSCRRTGGRPARMAAAPVAQTHGQRAPRPPRDERAAARTRCQPLGAQNRLESAAIRTLADELSTIRSLVVRRDCDRKSSIRFFVRESCALGVRVRVCQSP